MKQVVFRSKKSIKTVCIFQYGGTWRVQYTTVLNDKMDSQLIAYHNEEYISKIEAERAFSDICKICEG